MKKNIYYNLYLFVLILLKMPMDYLDLIHCISIVYSDISDEEYMDSMKEWVHSLMIDEKED